MEKPPERKKTPSQNGQPLAVLDEITQQLAAIREEGNERGKKIGDELASVKSDIAGVITWKEKLEREQAERIENYTTWKKQVDDDRSQVTAKATAATDAATEQLRAEMKSLRDHVTTNVGAVSEQLSVTNRVNRGMSQALGLNYDELARVPKGLTTTQANRIVTPPRATLTKLSRQQMASIGGQVLMIIILVLQILLHTR